MLQRHRWLFFTASGLILTSVILYIIHYEIFHDAHNIFFYLLHDIAFLPIQVLLVVIVLERLLARQERAQLLRKLNMVIGTFFSEMGTRLISQLTAGVMNSAEIKKELCVTSDWATQDYRRALAFVNKFMFEINADAIDMNSLKRMLAESRTFLMSMLANPFLLEHERFTDLLWAVEHLMEELSARPSIENLPPKDKQHIEGDIRRVYQTLTVEWLIYCQHLQKAYPYIFSIVVRTHPLQEHPDPTVR